MICGQNVKNQQGVLQQWVMLSWLLAVLGHVHILKNDWRIYAWVQRKSVFETRGENERKHEERERKNNTSEDKKIWVCKCFFRLGERTERWEETSERSEKQDVQISHSNQTLPHFSVSFLLFSICFHFLCHFISLSPSLPRHLQGSSKSRWRPLTSNMLPQFPW